MGRAARALAEERYAWPDIARRLEAIYERRGRMKRRVVARCSSRSC